MPKCQILQHCFCTRENKCWGIQSENGCKKTNVLETRFVLRPTSTHRWCRGHEIFPVEVAADARWRLRGRNGGKGEGGAKAGVRLEDVQVPSVLWIQWLDRPWWMMLVSACWSSPVHVTMSFKVRRRSLYSLVLLFPNWLRTKSVCRQPFRFMLPQSNEMHPFDVVCVCVSIVSSSLFVPSYVLKQWELVQFIYSVQLTNVNLDSAIFAISFPHQAFYSYFVSDNYPTIEPSVKRFHLVLLFGKGLRFF